jgi:23S rRNA (uracil1939-C5)-methyltransferase
LPLITGMEITGMGAEGVAIGRTDQQVVFVNNAIPGDVVDVQIHRAKRNYMEGTAIRITHHSPLRVDSFCRHFGTCGGCRWQDLEYSQQLIFKQQQVIDNLERIAKVELPPVQDILPAPVTRYYRNKLEYTFSNARWLTNEEISSGESLERGNALGFHIPRLFDKILDIEECHLQAEPSNSIRLEVKKYAMEMGLSFFDLRKHEGFLRTLMIRTSSTGEVMVIVSFYHEDIEARLALLTHLEHAFPSITSLMYVINPKAHDSITDQDVILFSGKDHIIEEMEGLQFKVGPKSFFQTNSRQALELYRITRDFAGLTGSGIVYDLYTGTGTIANFVARQCEKVIGIEYIPDAIRDAKENSRINEITNTRFFAGDMKDVLNESFILENGRPNVIILDPPRAGVHKDVIEAILHAAPERVVYVSCNPATQARDIQLLDEAYKLTRVQPVDMFPHTYHVENVVLLERRT